MLLDIKVQHGKGKYEKENGHDKKENGHDKSDMGSQLQPNVQTKHVLKQ